MKKLYVGVDREVETPEGGGLLITDVIPKLPRNFHPRVFDHTKHCLNPFAGGMTYEKACSIVESFDALFPRGNGTLTKDTGLDFLLDALLKGAKSFEELIPEPDKKSTTGHVWAYNKVQRLLLSPVLKRVFCGEKQFSLNSNWRSTIVLRVNRAELLDFDARALVLFFMSEFQGQIVVTDYGPYCHEGHINLLEQDRFIVGVNTLSEVRMRAPHLADRLLQIKDKVANGATFDDAEVLAKAAGLVPRTVQYIDDVTTAME